MSQKSGNDVVYDLIEEDFQVGGRKHKGAGRKRKTKKIRKHRGINQKTGRLNKGYKYSGKKLKSGLREIVKIKGDNIL
jgi:hypothetical protein